MLAICYYRKEYFQLYKIQKKTIIKKTVLVIYLKKICIMKSII